MMKSKVEHGDPKAPPPKASTDGHTPRFTAQNTSRAKLLRMGKPIEVNAGGAKTRP